MKNVKQILFCALFMCCSHILMAQYTQTVRGLVIDQAIKSPLPGATIVIENTNPILGSSTNTDGAFQINSVPTGRHNIKVSYMGYEPRILPNVLITSGKEVVLNIELKELVNSVDEVVVTAGKSDRPINNMVTLSGITLSSAETKRFAGGLDDPGRLAAVYAGVADGNAESNGVVVRGNAPTGVIYKVEGLEVNNPNHFFGEDLMGGGFISILNNHVLANSDFLTGAFPAEYGNAISAVFDLNIRNGNSQKYEHAFQVGILGIDFGSEGPISKKNESSYLVNYRYSTMGLISNFLPESEGIPNYQDLTFKLNFPTKLGTFTLWGSGGYDKYTWGEMPKSDSYSQETQIRDITATGFVGLKHKLCLNNSTYLTTSLMTNASFKNNSQYEPNTNNIFLPAEKLKSTDGRNVISTYLTKKFSKRHSNKTGINYINLFSNIDNKSAVNFPEPIESISDFKGNMHLLQVYSQSRFNLTNNLSANLGLHGQYLSLTNELSVEPRAGLQWNANNKNTFGLAYGLHSQAQLTNIYFVKKNNNGVISEPNKDLAFTKSHHIIASYDFRIKKNTRLKIEPFFQYLFNVPVIKDSAFSLLNLEDVNRFNESLENDGTATNIGVDLTLERFFNNGFYYLATASVFDSKYKDGKGDVYNTLFNGNFVANLLGGKEWSIGKKGLLGINARLYLKGGTRFTPVNNHESVVQQDVVYNWDKAYENRNPFTYRTDVGLTFRRNHAKYSTTWTLQILNVTQSEFSFEKQFNEQTQKVETYTENTMLPNISWKIEF